MLNASSKGFYNSKKKEHSIKPGWNEHVTELHTAARDAFKLRAESGGRPRQGSLFVPKQATNENIEAIIPPCFCVLLMLPGHLID